MPWTLLSPRPVCALKFSSIFFITFFHQAPLWPVSLHPFPPPPRLASLPPLCHTFSFLYTIAYTHTPFSPRCVCSLLEWFPPFPSLFFWWFSLFRCSSLFSFLFPLNTIVVHSNLSFSLFLFVLFEMAFFS